MLGHIAKVFLIGIGVSLLTAAFVAAQAPSTISYQGRLTDDTGQAISESTPVVFILYATPTGGTALDSVTLNVTPDANGVFTAELAFVAAAFDGSKRYLGIRVGGDSEMTPRQLLTSAPYSLNTNSIPDNAVTTGKIATRAVTNANLDSNAVTSDKIADGAVTNADLDSNAVTSDKIADSTVTSSDIVDGTITNSDISASAAIAISKIAGNAGIDYVNIPGDHTGENYTDTLGQVTVNTPSSGYVLVTLTGNAFFNGDCDAVIYVGVGTQASYPFDNFAKLGKYGSTSTTYEHRSFSTMYVAPVDQGTYTFYASALLDDFIVNCTVTLSELYLTAIFFPSRY